MLSWLLSLSERSRSREPRDNISMDVDDLLQAFGVHAYEEARRRRFASNDLANARRWGAVKSEIGRRILQRCGGAARLNGREVLLFPEDARGCVSLDWAAGRRQALREQSESVFAKSIRRGEEEFERIVRPSDEERYCKAA